MTIKAYQLISVDLCLFIEIDMHFFKKDGCPLVSKGQSFGEPAVHSQQCRTMELETPGGQLQLLTTFLVRDARDASLEI